MDIKKYSCEFILSSDLFADFKEIAAGMAESDPDFTWGCNNRSLITITDLLNHIDNSDFDDYADEAMIEKFRNFCKEIGVDTYVDLEN